MYATITKEKFLSEAEINFIVNDIYNNGFHYNDIVDNKLHSFYKPWRYYNKNFELIKNILDPKLKEIFDYDFVIDHSHILDSHVPYSIHTDYWQVKNFRQLEPAHSIIIPLDNYNSNTVIFNENSKIKRLDEYINQENPQRNITKISTDLVKNYLSHIDKDLLDYLSIKEILKWNKGCLIAFDRKYFHCSDNYYGNGLSGKKALILWTSTKI